MSPIPRPDLFSIIDEPIFCFLKKHKNQTLGDIRNYLKKEDLEYTKNSKGLEKRIQKLIKLGKIKKTYRPPLYPYYNIGENHG